MKTLLIPITDAESGERVVREVVERKGTEAIQIELLAVVRPQPPIAGRAYLTPQRADDVARTIGSTWLMRVTPILRAAGIPFHTRVVVGYPDAEIELAMHRKDIDSVVLAATAPRLPTAQRVTVVA